MPAATTASPSSAGAGAGASEIHHFPTFEPLPKPSRASAFERPGLPSIFRLKKSSAGPGATPPSSSAKAQRHGARHHPSGSGIACAPLTAGGSGAPSESGARPGSARATDDDDGDWYIPYNGPVSPPRLSGWGVPGSAEPQEPSTASRAARPDVLVDRPSKLGHSNAGSPSIIGADPLVRVDDASTGLVRLPSNTSTGPSSSSASHGHSLPASHRLSYLTSSSTSASSSSHHRTTAAGAIDDVSSHLHSPAAPSVGASLARSRSTSSLPLTPPTSESIHDSTAPAARWTPATVSLTGSSSLKPATTSAGASTPNRVAPPIVDDRFRFRTPASSAAVRNWALATASTAGAGGGGGGGGGLTSGLGSGLSATSNPPSASSLTSQPYSSAAFASRSVDALHTTAGPWSRNPLPSSNPSLSTSSDDHKIHRTPHAGGGLALRPALSPIPSSGGASGSGGSLHRSRSFLSDLALSSPSAYTHGSVQSWEAGANGTSTSGTLHAFPAVSALKAPNSQAQLEQQQQQAFQRQFRDPYGGRFVPAWGSTFLHPYASQPPSSYAQVPGASSVGATTTGQGSLSAVVPTTDGHDGPAPEESLPPSAPTTHSSPRSPHGSVDIQRTVTGAFDPRFWGTSPAPVANTLNGQSNANGGGGDSVAWPAAPNSSSSSLAPCVVPASARPRGTASVPDLRERASRPVGAGTSQLPDAAIASSFARPAPPSSGTRLPHQRHKNSQFSVDSDLFEAQTTCDAFMLPKPRLRSRKVSESDLHKLAQEASVSRRERRPSLVRRISGRGVGGSNGFKISPSEPDLRATARADQLDERRPSRGMHMPPTSAPASRLSHRRNGAGSGSKGSSHFPAISNPSPIEGLSHGLPEPYHPERPDATASSSVPPRRRAVSGGEGGLLSQRMSTATNTFFHHRPAPPPPISVPPASAARVAGVIAARDDERKREEAARRHTKRPSYVLRDKALPLSPDSVVYDESSPDAFDDVPTVVAKGEALNMEREAWRREFEKSLGGGPLARRRSKSRERERRRKAVDREDREAAAVAWPAIGGGGGGGGGGESGVASDDMCSSLNPATGTAYSSGPGKTAPGVSHPSSTLSSVFPPSPSEGPQSPFATSCEPIFSAGRSLKGRGRSKSLHGSLRGGKEARSRRKSMVSPPRVPDENVAAGRHRRSASFGDRGDRPDRKTLAASSTAASSAPWGAIDGGPQGLTRRKTTSAGRRFDSDPFSTKPALVTDEPVYIGRQPAKSLDAQTARRAGPAVPSQRDVSEQRQYRFPPPISVVGASTAHVPSVSVTAPLSPRPTPTAGTVVPTVVPPPSSTDLSNRARNSFVGLAISPSSTAPVRQAGRKRSVDFAAPPPSRSHSGTPTALGGASVPAATAGGGSSGAVAIASHTKTGSADLRAQKHRLPPHAVQHAVEPRPEEAASASQQQPWAESRSGGPAAKNVTDSSSHRRLGTPPGNEAAKREEATWSKAGAQGVLAVFLSSHSGSSSPDPAPVSRGRSARVERLPDSLPTPIPARSSSLKRSRSSTIANAPREAAAAATTTHGRGASASFADERAATAYPASSQRPVKSSSSSSVASPTELIRSFSEPGKSRRCHGGGARTFAGATSLPVPPRPARTSPKTGPGGPSLSDSTQPSPPSTAASVSSSLSAAPAHVPADVSPSPPSADGSSVPATTAPQPFQTPSLTPNEFSAAQLADDSYFTPTSHSRPAGDGGKASLGPARWERFGGRRRSRTLPNASSPLSSLSSVYDNSNGTAEAHGSPEEAFRPHIISTADDEDFDHLWFRRPSQTGGFNSTTGLRASGVDVSSTFAREHSRQSELLSVGSISRPRSSTLPPDAGRPLSQARASSVLNPELDATAQERGEETEALPEDRFSGGSSSRFKEAALAPRRNSEMVEEIVKPYLSAPGDGSSQVDGSGPDQRRRPSAHVMQRATSMAESCESGSRPESTWATSSFADEIFGLSDVPAPLSRSGSLAGEQSLWRGPVAVQRRPTLVKASSSGQSVQGERSGTPVQEDGGRSSQEGSGGSFLDIAPDRSSLVVGTQRTVTSPADSFLDLAYRLDDGQDYGHMQRRLSALEREYGMSSLLPQQPRQNQEQQQQHVEEQIGVPAAANEGPEHLSDSDNEPHSPSSSFLSLGRDTQSPLGIRSTQGSRQAFVSGHSRDSSQQDYVTGHSRDSSFDHDEVASLDSPRTMRGIYVPSTGAYYRERQHRLHESVLTFGGRYGGDGGTDADPESDDDFRPSQDTFRSSVLTVGTTSTIQPRMHSDHPDEAHPHHSHSHRQTRESSGLMSLSAFPSPPQDEGFEASSPRPSTDSSLSPHELASARSLAADLLVGASRRDTVLPSSRTEVGADVKDESAPSTVRVDAPALD